MINKIKEILTTLSNNTETFNVSVYKVHYHDQYLLKFSKNNKLYEFNFCDNKIEIRLNIKNDGNKINGREVGGYITIPYDDEEKLHLNMLLDTILINGKEYLKNSILNLTL